MEFLFLVSKDRQIFLSDQHLEYQMNFHWIIGECHGKLHEFNASLDSFIRAKKLAQEVIGDSNHIYKAKLTYEIARRKEKLGELTPAIQLHKKNIEMFTKLHASGNATALDIAKLQKSMGVCERKLGNYEKALGRVTLHPHSYFLL